MPGHNVLIFVLLPGNSRVFACPWLESSRFSNSWALVPGDQCSAAAQMNMR